MKIWAQIKGGFSRANESVKLLFTHPEIFALLFYVIIGFIALALVVLGITGMFMGNWSFIQHPTLLGESLMILLALGFILGMPIGLIQAMWFTHGLRSIVRGEKLNIMRSLNKSIQLFPRRIITLFLLTILFIFMVAVAAKGLWFAAIIQLLLPIISIFLLPAFIDEKVGSLRVLPVAIMRWFKHFFELLGGIAFFMFIALVMVLGIFALGTLLSIFVPHSVQIKLMVILTVVIALVLPLVNGIFIIGLYESRR